MNIPKRRKPLPLFLALICFCQVPAQQFQANWASLNTRKMPAWFHPDKFGIFIHWGVYSVPSYAPVIPKSGYSYAEWYWRRIVPGTGTEEKEAYRQQFVSFHNKNYGANFKYEQFEPQFKAEMFNPDQWAGVLKSRAQSMWHSPPNIMRDMHYGTARRPIGIG